MPRIDLSNEEVRALLLNSARELFRQNGIAVTEMKAIAEKAGLSRSTLYRYTIDKHQLAFLVVNQEISELFEKCIAFTPQTKLTGYDKLHAYCYNQIDIFEKNVPTLRLLHEFDSIYTGDYPDIDESRDYIATVQRLQNRTLQLVLEGLSDRSINHIDDPVMYAAALEHTLFGLSLRFFPREKHYMEEQHFKARSCISAAVDILLSSVKA